MPETGDTGDGRTGLPVTIEIAPSRWEPQLEDAVKVRVNHDLCEGHGKCAQAAPEVFDLRDDDLSHVKVDEVPERLHDAVRRAFRLCPRQAVILED